MKNFTLKMKSLVLSMLAIFAMATSGQAKVSDASELFGKYKFSATVEVTELGKAKGYANTFKSESDVVIQKSGNQHADAIVVGLLGIENQPLKLTVFNVENQYFEINAPNATGAWGGLISSSIDGINPYKMGVRYFPEYTYNEADGSISIPDFTLGTVDDYNNSEMMNVYVKVTNAKLTLVELDNKKPDTPQGGEFNWAQTFKIKAEVTSWNDQFTFPAEFDMEVKYWEATGSYMITKFLGYDMSDVDGGIGLTISETNPMEASIAAGSFVGVPELGKLYFVISDQNAQPNATKIVADEQGNLTFDNFYIQVQDFSTPGSALAPGALYANVKGTSENGGQKPETSFNWAQTFKIKAEVTSWNDQFTFPTEFDMEVKYWEDTKTYGITKFMGYDLSILNGGVALIVSESNPMEASLAAGSFIGIPELSKFYFVVSDQNAQPNPIKFVADEQGNLTIDNFFVQIQDFSTPGSALAPGALYVNVKGNAVVSGVEDVLATSSSKVSVVGNTIQLGCAQPVQVYSMSGKCAFSGVTSEVSGLAKGLYVVKTTAGATKVMVK